MPFCWPFSLPWIPAVADIARVHVGIDVIAVVRLLLLLLLLSRLLPVVVQVLVLFIALTVGHPSRLLLLGLHDPPLLGLLDQPVLAVVLLALILLLGLHHGAAAADSRLLLLLRLAAAAGRLLAFEPRGLMLLLDGAARRLSASRHLFRLGGAGRGLAAGA